jgi:hypothetical protein
MEGSHGRAQGLFITVWQELAGEEGKGREGEGEQGGVPAGLLGGRGTRAGFLRFCW